jgi:hypothetical protein
VNGPEGRSYRRTTKVFDKPRAEWIAVPESGIPREWVDAAREAIEDNQRQSAKGDRFWELSGGVLYCAECGCRMTIHASLDSRNGRSYCYYRCPKRGHHGVQKVCINGKHHRAAQAEAAVCQGPLRPEQPLPLQAQHPAPFGGGMRTEKKLTSNRRLQRAETCII